MVITNALLIIIAVMLFALVGTIRRQHRELIQWLDAYSEMVGEAIDSWRKEQE